VRGREKATEIRDRKSAKGCRDRDVGQETVTKVSIKEAERIYDRNVGGDTLLACLGAGWLSTVSREDGWLTW
jgi:hypothetical protein